MATGTYQPFAVLGLYTETPLHCGTESGAGHVDLPIQRERHTNYPVIPGSTIKGVLKDEVKRAGWEDDDVVKAFGGRAGNDTTPGQVSFGDGIIVAFPVRSTQAPFHWVTCPFVLERAGRALGVSLRCDGPGANKAWAKDQGNVLIEELPVTKVPKPELFSPGSLGKLLGLMPADDAFRYTREIFLDRLLVLRDEDFRELVETGTEILTRIQLNDVGTTAKLDKKDYPGLENLQGNMFVQEIVPPETLFLTVLRAPGAQLPPGDWPKVIRLGGDETIGRGVTHATVYPNGAGA